MNERAFRLDFWIAVAALLVSALTAATLIYQTRVIGHQFSATIWPYLDASTTYDVNGETISVSNDGLGPALIHSAQLSVDGVAMTSWNDYFMVLSKEPEIRKLFLRAQAAALAGRPSLMTITAGSMGPASTIRPGETDTLVKIVFNGQVPLAAMQALVRHRLALDFCYCALDGSCWTKHETPGQNGASFAQAVSACPTTAQIESNSAFTTPPPRAHR